MTEMVIQGVLQISGMADGIMGLYYGGYGYGYGYGYFSYLIFMLPALLLGLWAQAKVNGTFKKYSRIGNSRNITGEQVARMILDRNGLHNIEVERINGNLTDHYDPQAGVIRLSSSVYGSTSIGAIGVAAHEAGHAVQDAEDYVPIRVRNKIVPVCNFGSSVGPILILLGCMFAGSNFGINLMLLGIALFSLVALFQLVTLPVEFDASKRALRIIEESGQFVKDDYRGAKKVLTAAAMTYVAALVTSVMQILYYVTRFLSVSRRDDS